VKRSIFCISLSMCLLASGCATEQVLRIRSLSHQSQQSIGLENDGEFYGLKQLTETSEKNTNIIFFHGMGWTQERGSSPFGNELVKAIIRGYPGAKLREPTYSCATSKQDATDENPRELKGVGAGLIIQSEVTTRLRSDDPILSLTVSDLGCLDLAVVELPNKRTVSIYKYIWDDAMWDSTQWFHMRYDGLVPARDGNEIKGEDPDYPHTLRASQNAKIKRGVVTYGLSDAALYMNAEMGEMIRSGVEAAICVSLTNSFENVRKKASSASTRELCKASPESKSPLLLMSHSLGSRIVFDTLITKLSKTLATRISEGASNKEIEVHMFANQIPLVGIGQLGPVRSSQRIADKSIKLVAYSEINDLMTYELVPYFTQLYSARCYDRQTRDPTCTAKNLSGAFVHRADLFRTSSRVRGQLVDELGFDVVDLRLRFAPNEIPLIPILKDSEFAHNGHLRKDSVLGMFLCGVTKGEPRMQFSNCVNR
jgi:hypothetical protein